MGKRNIFKNQKTYVILLLIITGVFFYLRSVNRESYCDEILYGYNLNATEYGEYWSSPQTSLDEEIESLSDVINSQKNHYYYANGRSIVHAIEQFFTGVLSINIFYAVNTIIFILVICIIVNLLKIKGRYTWVLLSVLVFMYLFPMPYRLWYSINYGCNYLWPLCFSVIILYYYKKINDAKNISKYSLILLSLLSFITGWSHEAFSVPLSGALLFYIVLNFKKFDRRLLYVAIPMWIGAIIMVLAPANFARFLGGDSSKIYALANAIDNFMHIKLLWIFVITITILWFRNRAYLKSCLAEDMLIVFALIIGILFGVVANTAPYSFTAIELFSFLLTMRLIVPLLENVSIKSIYIVLLTFIFFVHQTMIVRGEIVQSKAQRELISNYVNSIDGVVNYNVPTTEWLTDAYVTKWKHSGVSVLYGGAIEFAYGNGKPMYALGDADYKFVADSNSYIEENKYLGDAPFYYAGGKAFWAKASEVDSTDVFEFEYEPVSFNYDVPLLLKIKFALTSDSYPSKEVAQLEKIKTRWGDYYYILLPSIRKPIEINYVK